MRCSKENRSTIQVQILPINAMTMIEISEWVTKYDDCCSFSKTILRLLLMHTYMESCRGKNRDGSPGTRPLPSDVFK